MRTVEFWQIEIATIMPHYPNAEETYAIGYAETLDGETVELKFKSVTHTTTKNKRYQPRWFESNNWKTHMRTRHKDLVNNNTPRENLHKVEVGEPRESMSDFSMFSDDLRQREKQEIKE